ncbi:MAG TPA: tetratricopeptide repeat protein [Candidatus Bathyarchaeia archaeon]|nr:tetratricopeptide repeat protein [Candidatus Bathyarchaeia archaeon]
MSKSAQTTTGFTTAQAYTLAVITLSIGIAMGYFARGSASVAPGADTAQAAAPAALGSTAMGAAQLPGIGSSQQQQGVSVEALNKAAETFLTQLKQNPNDFETLAKVGNLYYDGQAYPQAIEYYEKALLVQPGNADVRTDLGTAYWYTGDADKAIANFNKALAVRPTHPGTLFNLGIVEWQGKNDPKAAVKVWEKLLASNPDYPQKDQVQSLIERAKMHGASPSKG